MAQSEIVPFEIVPLNTNRPFRGTNRPYAVASSAGAADALSASR